MCLQTFSDEVQFLLQHKIKIQDIPLLKCYILFHNMDKVRLLQYPAD